MSNTTKTSGTWIVNIGLLVILAAVAMPLCSVNFLVYRWIFAAGALLHLIGRIILAPGYSGQELRQRRWHRIELWSAIMFAVAAVFMFLRNTGVTDWLAFTLAGGMLLVIANIALARTPRQQ